MVRNSAPIWAAVREKVISALVPLHGYLIFSCDFGSFWCIWPHADLKKVKKVCSTAPHPRSMLGESALTLALQNSAAPPPPNQC